MTATTLSLRQTRLQYMARPVRCSTRSEGNSAQAYSIRTEERYGIGCGVSCVSAICAIRGLWAPRSKRFSLTSRTKQSCGVTQNQRAARCSSSTRVLHTELPWLDNVESAKRRRDSVVLPGGVRRVLAPRWVSGLVLRLLYGTGMRVLESQLRVKDVDFTRREIVIREGRDSRSRDRCCRRRSSVIWSASSSRRMLHERDVAVVTARLLTVCAGAEISECGRSGCGVRFSGAEIGTRSTQRHSAPAHIEPSDSAGVA